MNITIIVLTYNHQDYICDCLESIRYQVERYGDEEHVLELIVTDDCSSDNTVALVKDWLAKYSYLFNNVIINVNAKNTGTCNNYENALAKSSGDYIKLLGGDDLFPPNSMYEIFSYLQQYDIVSGLPFEYVVNGKNAPESIQTLTHKLQCINYAIRSQDFYKLIEKSCFLNAPATYIRRDVAVDPKVVSFVRSYVFTEDYPQWVKMSEIKQIKYMLLDSYTIIYRRTEKSAVIVKGADPRFIDDRKRIYTYLYKRTNSLLTKVIIMGTLVALHRNKLQPNKYLNLLSYINKFYWIKNRKRTKPIALESIKDTLVYIDTIVKK